MFRFLLLLHLDLVSDKIIARDRSEILRQERRGLLQTGNIDVDRVGEHHAFRISNEHLPGLDEDGFAHAVIAEDPASAFKDDELDEGVRGDIRA